MKKRRTLHKQFARLAALLLAIVLCAGMLRENVRASGAGNSYPETYDLRDGDTNGFGESLVTSVKDQSPWSAIWGFGVISAAESSIIADSADYTVDNLDLAELKLAWFANTALPEDSEDYPSQGGEGTHWLVDTGNGELVDADETIGSYRLNSGTSTILATSVLASGTGPLLEDYAAYGGGVADYWIDTTTEEEHWSWSSEGDWTLDEEVRYWYSFVLKNTNILPNSAGNNEEGVQAIKSELMEGRAASAAYCADTSEPGDTSTYINTDTWAHYTYEGASATHQICIVGWDDTYSKYMFEPQLTTEDGSLDPQYFVDGDTSKGLNAEGQAIADASDRIPETDGAWIVKNSYGSVDEKSPNYYNWGIDGSGYFYLSYYDLSISMVETFEFDVDASETESEEMILDQYDLMTASAYNAIDTAELGADELAMANVFTASDDQMIRTVGVTTASQNTTVEVQIYLLNENAEDPTDGTPLLDSPATATFDYGGYHCIDLREYGVENVNLIVEKGQKYSVVVTLTAGSSYVTVGTSNSISAPVKSSVESDDKFFYYSEGVINEGESYVGVRSVGNTSYEWKDWAGMAEQAEASDPTIEYDNLPVKVYSDSISAVIDVSGNTTECILRDTVQITVDNTVKVEVSVDGGTSYADITDSYAGGYTVTENGTYLFRATNRFGTTTLASITYANIDNAEPVIVGIQDGSTYCETVTFTVDDDNIDSVTVNGVVVTDYTLAADGSTYKVVAMDKLGNSATCTVTVNNGHSWGATVYTWSDDGETCTATHTCVTDGSHVEEATATVTGVETKAATCTEAGETTYTAVFSESWASDQTKVVADISAKDHSLTHIEATAAICKEDGNTEYWYCSECEKYFNDSAAMTEISLNDTIISATGHSYEAVVTEPSCTTVGYTTNTCKVCGDSYTDNETEATGHSWDDGVVTIEATATTDGVKTYTCSECGETYIEVIPATGSAGSDNSDETESTATETSADSETVTTENNSETTFSPQTGDSTNLLLWITLMIIGGMGFLGAGVYNKKKKVINSTGGNE